MTGKTEEIRNEYLCYDAISLELDAKVEKIKQQQFDGIVAVLRGGAFAGFHIAFSTGVPCYLLTYDRLNAKVAWYGDVPKQGKMLLCEDFAGMGRTLLDCKAFLEDSNFDVETLVVCKDLKSASAPDFWCFDGKEPDKRFILPWERYRINKEEGLHSEENRLPDHEYERTAWSMDGMVEQNSLSIMKNASAIKKGDILLTSRSYADEIGIREWLQKHQIDTPFIIREDTGERLDLQGIANWKGRMVIQMGFTHYVEHDAQQAILIAAGFPELRVTWWNEGRPFNVQGAQKDCLDTSVK